MSEDQDASPSSFNERRQPSGNNASSGVPVVNNNAPSHLVTPSLTNPLPPPSYFSAMASDRPPVVPNVHPPRFPSPPDPWMHQQIRLHAPPGSSDGSVSSFPSTPADMSMTFMQDMYQRNAELNSLIQQLSPLLQMTQTADNFSAHPMGVPASPLPNRTDLSQVSVHLTGDAAPIRIAPTPATAPPPQPLVETVISSQQSVITSASGVTDPSPQETPPVITYTKRRCTIKTCQ